jgi:hypothetical protein
MLAILLIMREKINSLVYFLKLQEHIEFKDRNAPDPDAAGGQNGNGGKAAASGGGGGCCVIV